jgi:hypothetical protein
LPSRRATTIILELRLQDPFLIDAPLPRRLSRHTRADLASAMLRQLVGADAIKGLDQARNLNRAFRQ